MENNDMEKEERTGAPSNVNEEIATRYILENYSPVSRSGYRDPDLVTSADMVRELNDMISVTIQQISNLMWGAGFKIKFLDGKPHWEVFRS